MKKLIIIVGFLLSFNSVFAQGWVNFYGNLNYNQGSAINLHMQRTMDGGYVLLGGHGADTVQVIKTDMDGVQIWETVLTGGFQEHGIVNVIERSNGEFLVAVNHSDPPGTTPFTTTIFQLESDGTPINELILNRSCQQLIQGVNGELYAYSLADINLFEFNLNGDILWENTFSINNNIITGGVVQKTMDNGFIVAGVGININVGIAFLAKLDEMGNEEWVTFDSTMNLVYQVEETQNGEFVIAGEDTGNFDKMMVRKYTSTGNQLWAKDIFETNVSGFSHRMGLTESGDVLLLKSRFINTDNFFPILYKISGDDGATIWSKEIQITGKETIYHVFGIENGCIILFGSGTPVPDGQQLMLVKLGEDGTLYSNYLQGNLFHDLNLDCELGVDESSLKNWIVTLSGDSDLAKITNSQGDFYFEVDTGTYYLSAHPINNYWEPCDSIYEITMTTVGDTISQDIPIQAAVECPLMEVELFNPVMRTCPWQNSVKAVYCNNGTVMAEDATLEITLDEWMIPDSFSSTPDDINNNIYTFDLGDLSPLECGEITIYFQLDCDSVFLEQTLCMQAYVTPDTLCLDPIYQGPIIEADGVCESDSIRFILENEGGDMNESQQYIIIEDNIILFQEEYQLNNGEVQEIIVPKMANATYFLLATQSPNLPPLLGGSYASFAIENCEALPNSSIFNAFPLDDAEPYFDEICREVTGSYDPNDKQGFPVGFGPDHLIEANVDIDYLIRFQNTGNDTAFRVVIQDVLSEHLDITTLQPGGASHPYELEIVDGRTLKFTFDNILLPDSMTNELASQGYVGFKISQVPNNSVGTLIENTAAIYFDGNAPIITNTTDHLITEPFISIINSSTEIFQPELELKIYPNPAHEMAIFDLQNIEDQRITFKLFDTKGQLVAEQNFEGNQMVFYRNGLPSGIYFFQFKGKSGLLTTGKLALSN